MLAKQEALLGRGAQAESSWVREPKRTACYMAPSLRIYSNGISFLFVANHSELESFLMACASRRLLGHIEQHSNFFPL